MAHMQHKIFFDSAYQGYPLWNVLTPEMYGYFIVMIQVQTDEKYSPVGCFQIHKWYPGDDATVGFKQSWIGIGKMNILWDAHSPAIILLSDLENHLILSNPASPTVLNVTVTRF